MAKKHLFLLIILFSNVFAFAQDIPKVPEQMTFAGMKLKLNSKARFEIQENVNSLLQGGQYFHAKFDRIKTFMPIIEKHLKDKNLPEDFKYLPIQESDLIGTAVSSSNAVGYWQFKKPTALENGMDVDYWVDERQNIVTSTRGAANYLKKNNLYLDNWVHTLLSYYLGLGGVKRSINTRERGVSSMVIDGKTNWYIKKTLAHKIAFEKLLETSEGPNIILEEYRQGSGKTLKSISQELSVDYDELKHYNPWIKKGKIPRENETPVLIPYKNSNRNVKLLADNKKNETLNNNVGQYPIVSNAKNNSQLVTVNGIPGIIAKENDDIKSLAQKGNIPELKFISYNDIPAHIIVKEGELFYLKKKKNKSKKAEYHTLQYDETLWEVAQKYGIKQKQLAKKNRINPYDELKPGMVLWLKKKRPKNTPIEYKETVKPIEQEELVTEEVDTYEKPLTTDDIEPIAENEPEEKPIKIEDNTYDSSSASSSEKHDISEIEELNDADIEDEDILTEAKPQPTIGSPTINESTGEMNIIRHQVAKGETFYGIARKYNSTVEDLLARNGLSLRIPLSIGQVLAIMPDLKEAPKVIEETPISEAVKMEPKPTTQPKAIEEKIDEFKTYEVKPKDTMYSISKKLNATVEQIMKWNNKSDYNLSIGEVLKYK
ncbi:LysM peptidoglycan-binding domain-containing protein [Aureibacter tunicatorum]|nr:LysM peptidoglycan-binding domain-containing protein [Aureibacter tunicatorum]